MSEKIVCPLCQHKGLEKPGYLVQRVQDGTKEKLGVECNTSNFDGKLKKNLGCDFYVPFVSKILKNKEKPFTKPQIIQLCNGETLMIKGHNVFLDLDNPNIKENSKFYLKVEKLGSSTEEF